MAITLQTVARNAACDAVTALCNGAAPGKLNIKSAADVILCTIILSNPAFGGAVVGAATLNGLPKAGVGLAAAGAGTVATKYDVVNSADAVLWSGTIPADMVLDDPTIALNQAISITSWSHTQPA